MDPTKVDALYQIQNLSPGGGTSFDNYPSTGPYTGPTLFFDNASGLLVDASLHAQAMLASLVQQGVLGTLGYQQLQGPLFLVGDPAASLPPTFSSFWGAVIQDGGLGFYATGDGAVSDPLAYILYSSAPFNDLSIVAAGQINLSASSTVNGTSQFTNLLGGSGLVLGDSGFDTALGGSDRIVLENLDTTLILGSLASGGLDGNVDLTSLTLTPPYFSLQGGTYIGQYGTDSVGNVFSGGLCTFVGGGGGGVPWSSITGTPTTLSGYGISDGIGTGTLLGGDLAGFLPNPNVVKLQGVPLNAATPSLNDILTFDGTDWINSPASGGSLAIGNPISGSTPGEILYTDGSGNLGQVSALTWAPGTPLLTDSADTLFTGNLHWSAGGLQWLSPYVGNALAIFGGPCSVSFCGSIAGYFSDAARVVTICDGTNHVSYSPATPGDWAGTPPTDVWPALDRLAAACTALGFPP